MLMMLSLLSDYDDYYAEAVAAEPTAAPVNARNVLKHLERFLLAVADSFRPILVVLGIVLVVFVLWYLLAVLPKYLFTVNIAEWIPFLGMTTLRREFDMLRKPGRHYYAGKVYAYQTAAVDEERALIEKIQDYLGVAMEYGQREAKNTGVQFPDKVDVELPG